MNQEMMNKIDEVLKANGRQELSEDELGKVNGGDVGYICSVDGRWFSEQFVLDFARNLTEQFGYNIAAEVLCEKFGYSKTEIKRARCSSGDMDSIDVFVDTMFKIADKLENGGSCY